MLIQNYSISLKPVDFKIGNNVFGFRSMRSSNGGGAFQQCSAG